MAKRKKTKQKQTAQPNQSLLTEIREALTHFHDPAWLGSHLTLASPYFLGQALRAQSQAEIQNPLSRGQILQQTIIAAIDSLPDLDPKWGSDYQRLLTLRFLEGKTVEATMGEMSISENTYERRRQGAMAQLVQGLLQQVQPALRLEKPALPKTLLGRDTLIETGLAHLTQGKAIGLSGPGGIGKTTLGIWLADQFAPQATFWFTLQPGLNDQPRSLLFALAVFLKQLNATSLWSQMMVDQGETETAELLNRLRYDLANVSDQPVLLCFDETDLLRPEQDQAHAEIIALLNSLRGQIPLMFIGQKHVLESDHPLPLLGLVEPAMVEMLQQAEISLSVAARQQLLAYTQGNPRLLELFIAHYRLLQRAGEKPEQALTTLAGQPSLELLLRRIWPHLNEAEMSLLELLSVFRNSVPLEAWPDATQQDAGQQLITWHLVQLDRLGGASLLPAFKDAIYDHLLTVEEKEILHLEAGQVRMNYSQHTAAAFHYSVAGEPELALQLWETHREQEINQGQANAALAMLARISPRKLSSKQKALLTVQKAELQKLLGNYDQASKTLSGLFFRVPFLKARAKRLAGDIAELRGQAKQAIAAYQAGLETIEKYHIEAADFHRDLGFLYSNQRTFNLAQREVNRIRHEAANLEGMIQRRQGDLASARKHYLEAIAYAQEAAYAYGEANARNHLGAVLAWQRDVEQAEAHLQQSIQFFKRTKNVSKQASATFNLAFAYRLAEQYQAAISPAQEALALFNQVGESFGRAVCGQILAEVYLALDELEKAEIFAWQVLNEEEPNTQPDSLRTLGEIRLTQGKLSEAKQLIEQSLALAQDNDDPILAGYAYRALGEVHLAAQEVERGHGDLKKAITLFKECNLPEEVTKTKNLF